MAPVATPATASASGRPIMLVPKAGPTAKQITALDDMKSAALNSGKNFSVVVVGGDGAVSATVFNTVAAYDTKGEAHRLAGEDRAQTAVAVAQAMFGSNPRSITFAYGANYPDTISGGLLAYSMNAPILYGDSKVPAPYVNAAGPYLEHAGALTAYILGGPSLISDQFVIDLMKS